jgi:hypothetical protein
MAEGVTSSCSTACPPNLRDRKEIAYDAARFFKAKAKRDIIEIVDQSTGAKVIMLEDGRTG